MIFKHKYKKKNKVDLRSKIAKLVLFLTLFSSSVSVFSTFIVNADDNAPDSLKDAASSSSSTSSSSSSSASNTKADPGFVKFDFLSAYLAGAAGSGLKLNEDGTENSKFQTNLNAYIVDAGDDIQRSGLNGQISRGGSLFGVAGATTQNNTTTSGKVTTNTLLGEISSESVVSYDKSMIDFLDGLLVNNTTKVFNEYYQIGLFKDRIISHSPVDKVSVKDLDSYANNTGLLGSGTAVYNSIINKIFDFIKSLNVFTYLTQLTGMEQFRALGFIISTFAFVCGLFVLVTKTKSLQGFWGLVGKYILRVIVVFGLIGIVSSFNNSILDGAKGLLTFEEGNSTNSDEYIAKHILNFQGYVKNGRFDTTGIDYSNENLFGDPTLSEAAVLQMNMIAYNTVDISEIAKQLRSDLDPKNSKFDKTFTVGEIASAYFTSLNKSGWSRKVFGVDSKSLVDFFSDELPSDDDRPISLFTRSGVVGSSGYDNVGGAYRQKGLSPLATYNLLSSDFSDTSIKVTNTTATEGINYNSYYNFSDRQLIKSSAFLKTLTTFFLIGAVLFGVFVMVKSGYQGIVSAFHGALGSIIGAAQFIGDFIQSIGGIFFVCLSAIFSAEITIAMFDTVTDIITFFTSPTKVKGGSFWSLNTIKNFFAGIAANIVSLFLREVLLPIIAVIVMILLFLLLYRIFQEKILEKITASIIFRAERISGGVAEAREGRGALGNQATEMAKESGNKAKDIGKSVADVGKKAILGAATGGAGAALSALETVKDKLSQKNSNGNDTSGLIGLPGPNSIGGLPLPKTSDNANEQNENDPLALAGGPLALSTSDTKQIESKNHEDDNILELPEGAEQSQDEGVSESVEDTGQSLDDTVPEGGEEVETSIDENMSEVGGGAEESLNDSISESGEEVEQSMLDSIPEPTEPPLEDSLAETAAEVEQSTDEIMPESTEQSQEDGSEISELPTDPELLNEDGSPIIADDKDEDNDTLSATQINNSSNSENATNDEKLNNENQIVNNEAGTEIEGSTINNLDSDDSGNKKVRDITDDVDTKVSDVIKPTQNNSDNVDKDKPYKKLNTDPVKNAVKKAAELAALKSAKVAKPINKVTDTLKDTLETAIKGVKDKDGNKIQGSYYAETVGKFNKNVDDRLAKLRMNDAYRKQNEQYSALRRLQDGDKSNDKQALADLYKSIDGMASAPSGDELQNNSPYSPSHNGNFSTSGNPEKNAYKKSQDAQKRNLKEIDKLNKKSYQDAVRKQKQALKKFGK